MKEEVIYNILCIGIFRFAYSIRIQEESAIKEAVYCFHHERDKLSARLLSAVANYTDDYYRGYGGIGYAENEMDALRPVFEDEDLKLHLTEWYRIRQVLKLLDIDIPFNDIILCADKSKHILTEEGNPSICVNTNFIKNKLDDAKVGNLPARKRALLSMYLGILSLIGNKEYAATSSEAIISRMFGAKNKEQLSMYCEDEEFRKVYEQYSTRRKYYSLITELEEKGMIVRYSYNRTTFISVKLDLDSLVKAIQKDSKSYRLKELKEAKRAVTEKYFGKR